MLKALLLIIPMLFSLDSEAQVFPVHKSSLCASILMNLSLRRDLVIQYLHPDEILRRVTAFKNRSLEETDVGARLNDVFLTSVDAKANQNREAQQQINGLIVDLKEGETKGLLTTAAEFRGKEAIQKFLDAVETEARDLSRLKSPKGLREIVRMWESYSFDALAVVSSFAAITWLPTADLSQLSYVYWAALVGVGVFYTEHSIRAVLSREWNFSNQRKEIANFLDRTPESPKWILKSRNLVMRILAPYFLITEGSPPDELFNYTLRDFDKAPQAAKFLRQLMGAEALKERVVLDELYTTDPMTREPILLVIVRAQNYETNTIGLERATDVEAVGDLTHVSVPIN